MSVLNGPSQTLDLIDAVELVPGDVVLLEQGERIAADMQLLSGAVEVDLSTLTGESVAVLRSAEFQDAGVPRLEGP
jgi:P-type E1-E2 ATPase